MKQLNPLTGLRGIAAYAVLIAHSISTAFFYNNSNLLQPIALRLAYAGMSLFFILSGFVIYYNYGKLLKTDGLISGGYQFIVARFARLYPLYALVIIFSLDSVPSSAFQAHEWGATVYSTLTQSWFNMQGITFEPAWSISTEWFFYAGFIVLFPIFNKIQHPRSSLIIFTILTLLILPVLLSMGIKSSHPYLTRSWLLYYSPFTRIFEFIAGIMACKIYLAIETDTRDISKAESFILWLCLAWCATFIFIDPINHGIISNLLSNFIYAPATAPLLVLCCRYNTFISRILSSRPLMFMGEISYSVYLLQFWVLTGLTASFVSKNPPTEVWINPVLKMLAIITLTTMIAYGCYHLFEKPCRNLIRNLLLLHPRKIPNELPMTSNI